MKNTLLGGFWEGITEPINLFRVTENCKPSNDNKKDSCENRSSLKWNRYNYIKKENNNNYLLFNSSTNNYMFMVEEIKELINDNMYSVNKIESIHPDLYFFLKKKMFIVDEHFDEVKAAIIQIKKERNLSDRFEIIINSTLDCNLRCWYCYESRQKKSHVNDNTLRSIMCLIKNKVESQELKIIDISFFGGEPLLEFNRVIWPIIEYTKKICAENRKEFHFAIITNGVLLTRKIVDKLYENDIRCFFQIPFDGNEEYHNKIKKFSNGKGTFDKTIINVMYALSQGFRIIIRCNYTSESLNSFDELISIFTEFAGECIDYGLLTFDYHKVWQAKGNEGMQNVVDKYKDRTNFLNNSFYQCYADRENSVAINYNGDIYNCTANDFIPDYREGYLNEDGKIIYNEKHKKRMESRFSDKNCLDCMVFPICYICTQKRIQYQDKSYQCLRFLSEEEKERLLLKRIEMVCNV